VIFRVPHLASQLLLPEGLPAEGSAAVDFNQRIGEGRAIYQS
jgi:hypothetical protein